jgi:hypothetical protein
MRSQTRLMRATRCMLDTFFSSAIQTESSIPQYHQLPPVSRSVNRYFWRLRIRLGLPDRASPAQRHRYRQRPAPAPVSTASRHPGQNAKHQTFNLVLTWLLLASAPQSAGAIFRRPSGGGGPSIRPPVEPDEVRRSRGKSAAAADIQLSSYSVAFSLLSARTCVSHLASHPPFALARPCDRLAPAKSTVARCRLCTECGKADQRRAWRRRPPLRRATIRSSKSTVCWLKSLRPNTRIPLARLLLCPHT